MKLNEHFKQSNQYCSYHNKSAFGVKLYIFQQQMVITPCIMNSPQSNTIMLELSHPGCFMQFVQSRHFPPFPSLYSGTDFTCNAIARICHANSVRQFRPSVRLSVTRVLCLKTAERIIEILSLSDRPVIPVFRHQGSLRKSDGFTPNGDAKYNVKDFRKSVNI